MRTITLTFHHEDDSWWVESPDVAGFTAVGKTFLETRDLAREGLHFYLDGESCRVVELLEDGTPLTTASLFSPDYVEPRLTLGQRLTFGSGKVAAPAPVLATV